MEFEHMSEIQRRLHNASCILDEYGFDQLQQDAIAEIEKLRYALKIAAQTFGEYAEIHAAKTPPDENKVRRNENLRDLCNEALGKQ